MMVQHDLFSEVAMEEAQKPDLSKHCPPGPGCGLRACRYHTGSNNPSTSCALRLAGERERTREEVAIIEGISVEAVTVTERRAIRKLKTALKKEKI